MFGCYVSISKQVLHSLQRLSISTTTMNLAAATQSANKRRPKGYNAPTAFGLFTKQEVVTNVPISEQAKTIAQKWSTLSSEEKERFQNESMKIAKKRADEFAKLNETAKSALINEDAVKKEKLIKHRIKMASKQFKLDTKRPVCPLHPYIKFFKQEMANVGKLSKATIGEHAAAIGNAWKQMSSAEKKPHIDAYETEVKKHRADLARWTEIYGAEYKKVRASFQFKPKKVIKKAKPVSPGKKSGRQGGLYKRLLFRKTASAPKKAISLS